MFINFEKNIFHVIRNGQLIVLDVTKNSFKILSEKQSDIVKLAFETSSWKINSDSYLKPDKFGKEEVKFIQFLINNNVISSKLSSKQQDLNLTLNAKNTFFSWTPPRTKIENVSLLYFFLSIKFLFVAKRLIKRDGFLSIIKHIHNKRIPVLRISSDVNIEKAINSFNFATNFFSSTTRCLAWSAGLIFLLQRLQVKATFVVGIQTYPFISHAWVEIDDIPIGNNKQDCEALSKIIVEKTFESTE